MGILTRGAVSRGTFIRGIGASLALAAAGGPLGAIQAHAAASEIEEGRLLPSPKPIPGGIDLPPLIHVREPGTPAKVLPFTGAPLEGLDIEPCTMNDFKGVIAQAYHVGTARGSDGKSYNLETDIRVYQGEYVALNGSHNRGTFALL